jgi:hypothetical protein
MCQWLLGICFKLGLMCSEYRCACLWRCFLNETLESTYIILISLTFTICSSCIGQLKQFLNIKYWIIVTIKYAAVLIPITIINNIIII